VPGEALGRVCFFASNRGIVPEAGRRIRLSRDVFSLYTLLAIFALGVIAECGTQLGVPVARLSNPAPNSPWTGGHCESSRTRTRTPYLVSLNEARLGQWRTGCKKRLASFRPMEDWIVQVRTADFRRGALQLQWAEDVMEKRLQLANHGEPNS
jgi:hypothetical protein